jgi:hypothetical protein
MQSQLQYSVKKQNIQNDTELHQNRVAEYLEKQTVLDDQCDQFGHWFECILCDWLDGLL